MAEIDRSQITGLILAGGRGSRMGGVDKGLQPYHGVPLALHALMRLAPQVGELMINANRNLAAYESFGAAVWPDATDEFAGPLAGFLAGLERCETPLLATVPCDTPAFRRTWSRGWPRRSRPKAPTSRWCAAPTPRRLTPGRARSRCSACCARR